MSIPALSSLEHLDETQAFGHSEGVLALGHSQGTRTAKALGHSGTRCALFRTCFIKIYRSAVFVVKEVLLFSA